MKSSIMFLTLAIFIQSQANSQWRWQNPLPQGNNLSAVQYIDAETAWAGDDGASVVRTTDGGSTWDVVTLPSRIFVQDIFFLNKDTGWAGGQSMLAGPHLNSELLRTTDAGRTWTTQLFDSIGDFEAIFFSNERQGWVSGQSGRMFHTSDGGDSWQLQTELNAQTIYALTFTDSLHGWAGGTVNRRLHTSNGGASWAVDTLIYSIFDIQFLDSLRGWQCGESQISMTTDGGISWHVQLDTFQIRWKDIFFLDTQYGWAVSQNGLIVATTNGGSSWNYQYNPTGGGLEGISFIDSLNGIAVGHQGTILKTSNSGTVWESATQAVTSQPLYAIHFLDTLHGWIAGWGGTILKTTNGGETWDSLPTGTNERLFSIYFTDSQHGWAVGRNGMIIHTTDGGSAWFLQPSPVVTQFTDIDFSNYPVGWVIGGDPLSVGHLLKTSNGGYTWTEDTLVALPSGAAVIQFTSADVGWLSTGSSQQIYKTTDGGGSWIILLSNSSFTALDFIDDSSGWVAVNPPDLLRTRNGGSSWDTLSIPVAFNRIFFVDSTDGWGGAFTTGEIYHTTDGGNTWSSQRSPLVGTVRDLKFIGKNSGWAVSNFGAVVHTSNGGITLSELDHPVKTLPSKFALFQNFPNPFNPSTTFRYDLPANSSVTLRIYNVLGQVISTVVDGTESAGHKSAVWKARKAASGVYFYRLEATSISHPSMNFTSVKKMVLIK